MVYSFALAGKKFEKESTVMKELLTSLEGLGFTTLECKIYLSLLEYGPMSPYQIAKKIDISRSSIYNALEHMVSKGMVAVVPEDTVLYIAQDPQVFLGKVEGDYVRNLKQAKSGLEHFLETRYEENYAIMSGFHIIVEKVKRLLENAKEEVFINTDIELEILREELSRAVERGVRVFVFSFVEMNSIGEGIEIYSHMRKRTSENTDNRLMIVVDDEMAVVADANKGREDWKATVTNNKLMKNIVREHIHNDIYMLKLRQIYGREMYENIHIHTKQEQRDF